MFFCFVFVKWIFINVFLSVFFQCEFGMVYPMIDILLIIYDIINIYIYMNVTVNLIDWRNMISI